MEQGDVLEDSMFVSRVCGLCLYFSMDYFLHRLSNILDNSSRFIMIKPSLLHNMHP